jgi:phosphatidylserine/phosphatidylglycerophosphate/cardiolipin synthase-like enzyme
MQVRVRHRDGEIRPELRARRPLLEFDDWFLTADERGNAATEIDRRRGDGTAWTEGNRVEPLIDGATYFARLYEVLGSVRPDDWVHLTDWEGDPDERLVGPGTAVGHVLADLARQGTHVRGLLWRSHPRQAHFSEEQNTRLVREVNKAGGEIVLDERVRRGGSHHQKLVFVRRASGPDDDVAFVGGIDLCHGRHDDSCHAGDPQAIELDERYGDRPPWHDIQLELHGPAVGDVAQTFRERWEDPTPLDHRNPLRVVLRTLTRQPRRLDPLPPQRREPRPAGPHAVQVIRTYPAKRSPYPFAPDGERSIGRAHRKAIRRARKLIYVEDQYLWSHLWTTAMARALREHLDLRVIAVVPRFAEHGGRVTANAENIGRQHVIEMLRDAGGERVAVYDLENVHGTPIYVHAKTCVIDDVWLEIGSDNLNRRSWTHDSELSCAVLDTTVDDRDPADPGGLGDRARVLPRDTRLRLWREHLGRSHGDDADLLDPVEGFEAWRSTASALDAWHEGGRRGSRPPGHARVHTPEQVPRWQRRFSRLFHRLVVDPDGRPRRLRGSEDL